MPRKGMKSLWFSPKHSSSSSSSSTSNFIPPASPSRFSTSCLSPSHPSFSDSVMSRTLEMAEPIITKWNPETTPFARVTSLLYQNRREAREFIKTVNNLQKAMQFQLTDKSGSDKLARAQCLMQMAMQRLQKEFYQILSMNRAQLDPESVSTRSSRNSISSSLSEHDDEDEDDRTADHEMIPEIDDASTVVMADLRLIAECMISSGYAKECLKIYKMSRKSIVDECVYRLGVEKFSSSQVRKMDWDTVEWRIQSWVSAVRTGVKILFNGERILCDNVFASFDSIREWCFTEITKDGAMILFGFPENVTKNSKISPEKIFRVLDMYAGISDHWPEIDSIFSFESNLTIKSQALTSLVKLAEFVRSALNDFETVVLKDLSKTPVPGGGIHQMTINAMAYLSILADYSNILSDILEDSPPPAKLTLPLSYFGFSDSDESPAPAISIKIAYLILALLCKLDIRAEYYKDVSLAYLFLANNLQYVVVQVWTSNLKHLLGDEWVSKHESKVKQFAANYERLGWSDVINSIPSNPTAVDTPEEVNEILKKFNASFNQAYRKQSLCIVPDRNLRDDIKFSIESKIVPSYREFYYAHRPTIRKSASLVIFTPESVARRVADLFFSNIDTEVCLSFRSLPPQSSPRLSLWRPPRLDKTMTF